MHLTNTVILDGKLVAFDCLEFNLALRMIDVCCDIAFFIMDMDFRGESGLGAAFLSSYLESSGDFEAIGLLRYFLVYRTMVCEKAGGKVVFIFLIHWSKRFVPKFIASQETWKECDNTLIWQSNTRNTNSLDAFLCLESQEAARLEWSCFVSMIFILLLFLKRVS